MASSNQFYDLKNKRIVLGLSLCGLPTHAQGSLKPIQFLQSRNNEIIYRFNRKLSEFLEPIGVPVFDTFNLTLGVHSYVGSQLRVWSQHDQGAVISEVTGSEVFIIMCHFDFFLCLFITKIKIVADDHIIN